MKNRKLYYFSYVFFWMIFGQSLISAQTAIPPVLPANQSPETNTAEENLIHLGDLIDVDVVGSYEYDWRGMPSAEGFLNIGYNQDPIKALCRNEEAVAADIAKAFEKILRQPKVIVTILDHSNRPVAVLYGAVKTPQRFRINRPVFLNELIINAGGFTEKVSGEIQVFRATNLNCLSETKVKNNSDNENQKKIEESADAAENSKSQYINIKISDLLAGREGANAQILSGDVITVVEAESVYVTGGVVNPKQIPLRSQITLSRAVASAGGLSKDAIGQKITIFRRENKDTKTIEADLDKVKANLAEDIVLQAFDIIEVAKRGSSKTHYPPIIKTIEPAGKNAADLPLRIID